MKKQSTNFKLKIIFFLFFLSTLNVLKAQVFDIDTIQYHGDKNNYLNLVIMGDGYTATEQGKFITDATGLTNYLFSEVPWSNYKMYFNVFAIKVISNESGAKHPNTAGDCTGANVPVSNPDNYFGCTFDGYGIHRLIIPGSSVTISNVLSANFPNYDQVFIVANSPYYGGSGGTFATFTTHTSVGEIAAHEIGHSFVKLADEYYAGDVYFGEKANMTQETDTTLVKWKNWLNYNQTGVYAYCCGGSSSQWYRPHKNCKMEFLGKPFCSVCKEATIEKIHDLVNPIVNYTPTNLSISASNQKIAFKLTEIMKPVPNSLNLEWKMDGQIIHSNVDSIKVNTDSLSVGTHTLTVNLIDTSYFLRVNNHSTKHISTVSWIINKSLSNIKLVALQNQITYTIFPNPTAEMLNVELELEKSSNTVINILNAEGKIVKNITNQLLEKGKHLQAVKIDYLASGIYFIQINTSGATYTEKFVKQ